MENKYYTPTIEEFHVGFEYETYVTVLGLIQEGVIGAESNYWKKTFMNAQADIIAIDFNIRYNGVIRVKYLDREDIESLGWKGEGVNLKLEGCKYLLQCGSSPHQYIRIYEPSRESGAFTHELIFWNVKNKSELKKIMQQLKIIK